MSFSRPATIGIATSNIVVDLASIVNNLEPSSDEFAGSDQQISARMFGAPLMVALSMNPDLPVPQVVETCTQRLLKACKGALSDNSPEIPFPFSSFIMHMRDYCSSEYKCFVQELVS